MEYTPRKLQILKDFSKITEQEGGELKHDNVIIFELSSFLLCHLTKILQHLKFFWGRRGGGGVHSVMGIYIMLRDTNPVSSPIQIQAVYHVHKPISSHPSISNASR